MLEGDILDPPTVLVFRNPFDVTDFEASGAIPGADIFSWLTEHYPNGFGRPISLIYNGNPLAVEDSDIPFQNGDHLAIMVSPGEPVSVSLSLTAILTIAAISAAASIAAALIVSLIFGRPKQKKDRGSADPVYSLDGGANTARLGEPIPVGFGTFITYPDYVCPPYTFFEDNQQYLDQILCIGQGDYNVHDVLIEDTSASQLINNGIMSYDLFLTNRHMQTMGNIEAATGVSERMLTSLEVSDIELSGVPVSTGGSSFSMHASTNSPNILYIENLPDELVTVGMVGILHWPGSGSDVFFTVTAVDTDTVYTDITDLATGLNVIVTFTTSAGAVGTTSGPFTLSRPGVEGDRIYTDIVFPSGLFTVDEDTGDFESKTVEWNVTIQKIHDDGSADGAAAVHNETYAATTNTPQRITREYAVAEGRYTVQIARVTPADTTGGSQSNMVWSGLRFRTLIVPGSVYSLTTLLAIRLRATSGISSDVASKIRVHATRLLPRLGAGPRVETQSPADAFINVITNVRYGAGRPQSEIDIARLTELDTHWGAEGQFNGIFATKSTVWEALGLICQTVVCIPVVVGAKITMIQDGMKLFSTQMFSSANMATGSFSASYSFNRPGDHKGVSVEYRSPLDFSQQYETFSDDLAAVDFDNVVLFGCTSSTIAKAFARLLWQRKKYQRQNFAFDTEMEGLIPSIGERVSIANDVIDRSVSGQVVGITPGATVEIILDRHVDLSTMINPGIVLRADDGTPSPIYPVVQGSTPFTYTFIGAIPFSFTPGDAIALWSIGEISKILRKVVVTAITAQGKQALSVQAIKYDERAYTGTLAFLQVPI